MIADWILVDNPFGHTLHVVLVVADVTVVHISLLMSLFSMM